MIAIWRGLRIEASEYDVDALQGDVCVGTTIAFAWCADDITVEDRRALLDEWPDLAPQLSVWGTLPETTRRWLADCYDDEIEAALREAVRE